MSHLRVNPEASTSDAMSCRAAAERIARAICAGHPLAEKHWQEALLGPLDEFLRRPGKGFRGGLVESCWLIAGGDPQCVPHELSLALELLHAGSLIVDDIQDASRQRRGAPALHHLVGLPLALNTGNWLYFAAAELIDQLDASDVTRLRLLRQLRSAILRCHSGQGLDLSARVSSLAQDELPALVAATTDLKTASLTELAATLGSAAAEGDDKLVIELALFGKELGLALQMFDDLGGIVAPERLNKGLEDLRLSRPTWLWAWAAKSLDSENFEALVSQSRAVEEGGDPEALLTKLRSEVAEVGRLEASAHLRFAYQRLSSKLPASPALRNLVFEIKRLEQSYV